jgi:hypothetical protein
MERFSARHGFQPTESEITVREDAPHLKGAFRVHPHKH